MHKKIIIPDKVIFEENSIKINVDGDEHLEFTLPFYGEVSKVRIFKLKDKYADFGEMQFKKNNHYDFNGKIVPDAFLTHTICIPDFDNKTSTNSIIVDSPISYIFDKGSTFVFIGKKGQHVNTIELFLKVVN